MDGELAGETLRRGGARFGDQPGLVAEVGEHAVDRLDFGRDRAGQAQRPGQLVGEGELASAPYLDEAPSAADRSSAPQLIAARPD